MIDLRHLKWGFRVSSTGGVMPKDVIECNSCLFHLKMSAYNKAHGVYGIQAFSEVIASRIADILGINCVKSELVHALVRIDDREFETFISYAKDYKNGRRVLPIEDMYSNSYSSTMEMVENLRITEEIHAMFVFDYVISNFDRHGRNVEYFVDTGTLAPLFDNGLSLQSVVDESRIDGYIQSNNISNNFIGSRDLYSNLSLIENKLTIGELRESLKAEVFQGLEGLLSPGRINAIWNNVITRYDNVKKLRII